MEVEKQQQEEEQGHHQNAAGEESGQPKSLPMESSPYVKYSDLEDYKRQGYGTVGHLEPVETGKGGGSTDAPTLCGSNLSNTQAQVVDSLHRRGNA